MEEAIQPRLSGPSSIWPKADQDQTSPFPRIFLLTTVEFLSMVVDVKLDITCHQAVQCKCHYTFLIILKFVSNM